MKKFIVPTGRKIVIAVLIFILFLLYTVMDGIGFLIPFSKSDWSWVLYTVLPIAIVIIYLFSCVISILSKPIKVILFLLISVGYIWTLWTIFTDTRVIQVIRESRMEHPKEFTYKFLQGFYYNDKRVIYESFCFGDVCPQNGGTTWIYEDRYGHEIDPEQCLEIGGAPLIGISWGYQYVGCEAITEPLTEEERSATLERMKKLNYHPPRNPFENIVQ